MKKILDHYEINGSTMALLTAANMDYCTIVLEETRKLFVQKTPIEIVKASCLEGGSTYDGRRIAVTYRIGSKQKVPIPINPRDKIFAFPTQSPRSFECSWIFYQHVKHIKRTNSPTDNITLSTITFHNGQQIMLNESHYVLEKQMQRTAMCILGFLKKDGVGQGLYRSPCPFIISIFLFY